MYSSGFLNAICDSAKRLNIQIKRVDKQNGRLIELSSGNKSALFGATPLQMWPYNSSLAASIVKDKELTLRLLNEELVPVPKTEIAFYDISPYSHLKSPPPHVSSFLASPPLCCPFVVKPNDARSGRGIVFVYSLDIIEDAIKCASLHSNAIVIQELIEGQHLKIYSYKGKGIVKIVKKSISLNADGKRTAREILKDYRAMTQESQLSLKSYLSQFGSEILPCGQNLDPFPVSNYNVTQQLGHITSELAESESLICQIVYTKLCLDFCTIDYIMDRNGNMWVMEVNSNPSIEILYKAEKNDLALQTIDFFVKTALNL